MTLADDDRAFLTEVRALLNSVVTDEVRIRDHESGENFDEEVHLALGAHGWLAREWLSESEGGLSPLRRRLWELETRRVQMPYFHWDTTKLIARTLKDFASSDLKGEVLPGVLTGHVRLCLGYTEPEGGSDVATCKTRAVQDGGSWVINGAKMFTSNAQNSQYVFLITNTAPKAPKHQSLTMFLVPLTTPGIEIQGLRTVDGDRTNLVYYSDVRIDDRYRVGDVHGGWTVLRSALNAEHGGTDSDASGLNEISILAPHGTRMLETIDAVVASAASEPSIEGCLLDDQSVKYRLGRSISRAEAAVSTPGIYGRVALAQTMRDISADLMDVAGARSSLLADAARAADHRTAEKLYRLALPSGIYGGTIEVFRNMIAQHEMGLGRPTYSPTTVARGDRA